MIGNFNLSIRNIYNSLRMETMLLPKSFILPGQPTRYARDIAFKIEHLKLEIEPDFESKKILAKELIQNRDCWKAHFAH